MSGVVAVIPARWGSTRFPGKILAPVCGRPLLHWVLERVGQAKTPSRLLVATDDERIARAAAEAGVESVMTRPDHPSGTDRIAEAVRDVVADVVVNVQGDEPLISPDLIDELAGALSGPGDFQMATAAVPLDDAGEIARSSVVKVVMAEDGAALYFSRSVIPHIRDRPAGEPLPAGVYRRHVGIYAYRRDFLFRLVQAPPSPLEELEKLEQLRALHIGGRIKVLAASDTGAGVDEPGDVPRVEARLRALGLA